MVDVEFHPEAQDDYDAALCWYAERSRQVADHFEAEVERMLDLVVANPESFPRYDLDHRFAVLMRFPYSVIYQPLPNKVYVVAVAHSKRAADYWSGRY